jgi:hypothetical protein
MPVLPWLIAGVIGLVFTVVAMIWVAAQFAAGPAGAPSYGQIVPTLTHHGLIGLLGTGGSPIRFTVVLVLQAILLLGAVITVALLVSRRHRHGDGRQALTASSGFRDLQQSAMAKRAQGLRPSLAGTKARHLAVRQIGASLGDIGGRAVFKSWEDVELVICGPRSNKTSAKVVPDILSAPGAVVATSNKPDVWILTAALRARVGPLWLFDPQRITWQTQNFWWDPLKAVTSVEAAERLAAYFMREVGLGTKEADPFFTPAAASLLKQLLLAAASSDRCSLREVLAWIATRAEEPATLLERAGYAEQAQALRATLELPWETKGGVFGGATTAMACLESEALLRWVTPPETWKQPPSTKDEISELDLWHFVATADGRYPTLYLLSREGPGSGRPVLAAIVGELMQVAVQAASARGGRLDPVITVQLDECANIVRIPELPNWMSWFGSMGLEVTVVLQSREQGRSVWGKEGFDALWSAATVKTIGAGVQDADFTEELSRLIGEHKVEETSTSYSAGGHSVSRSLHTERILTAADIAALERTNALLFTSGRRPALVRLHPWYAERDDAAADITRYSREAIDQVQQAAVAALGEDNPVAQALRGNDTPSPR